MSWPTVRFDSDLSPSMLYDWEVVYGMSSGCDGIDESDDASGSDMSGADTDGDSGDADMKELICDESG